MKPFVLAIDGPAGAGKSTTARGVARRLGLLHVDSGSMYRAVAWKAREKGVSLEDEGALVALLERSRIEPGPDGVTVDGVPVESSIRTANAGEDASRVALHPGLRRKLVGLQRSFARPPGLVMEGRDIGTVVFPDAELKVYLTASPEARAGRRAQEVTDLDYETVAADIARRDALDQGRDDSPLVEAPDAVTIDTTDRTIDEVVDAVLARLDG